jgi:putative hydrolase of the HAD superfamily
MSSRKRIHAVLFDLDDTLIDWSGLTDDFRVYTRPHLDNLYDYLARRGHALPDRETFTECYVKTIVEHWAEARETWCAVNFRSVLQDFTGRLDLDVSQIDYQEMMHAYEIRPIPDLALFSDAIPVLQALREQSYKIGLITNSMLPMWMRDVELEAYDILEYFDVRITSGDMGYIKPHPHIYERALELLGVGPEQALFVGDRPEYDIAGANEAGLTSVLISHHYLDRELNNVQPDYIISSLSDLLPILEALEES